MKSISQLKESEKFNKFINECEEFAISNKFETDITKSFPRFILYLYFNLNKEKIEEALRGLGSNDDGIDAFFISEEEKKINLIQFKSRKHHDEKEAKDAKKEWFNMLESFCDRIKKENFQTKNKRIIEIKNSIEEFEFENYSTELHLFHLGNCSSIIENNFNNIKYYCQNEILQKFVQFYEADLSNDCAPDEIELTIDFEQNGNFQSSNNCIYFTPKAINGKQRKTIAFPIDGKQIIDLINKGTTILDRNVRGYLGENNAVNKGIIKTALESPEHFYFFNNGISITCDELTVTGITKQNPKIKLIKPQIINGAQTVNSLEAAYRTKIKQIKKNDNLGEKEAKEKTLEYMRKITVLCKIMESNKRLNTDFAKSVTQYSNTQNKIKPTDFYANRPEQIRIKEDVLKYGITYNIKRGKNFEYKQGFYINMEDLAENHLAQTEEPFSAKLSIIFIDECENNDKSNYFKIFGNKGSHDSKRAISLAKTFFIYNSTFHNFNYIRKTYQELETQIGKKEKEIDEFRDKHTLFFKLTNSLKYFLDLSKGIDEPAIDNVSKYIYIMDFKILSYFVRNIIDRHFLVDEYDNKEKISIVFEKLIENNNYDGIESLIQKILRKSLTLYSQVLKDLYKGSNPLKIQKRHSKTKEVKNLIDDKISEYISDDDYIKHY